MTLDHTSQALRAIQQISVQDLRVVVTVAEVGSFRGAASQLLFGQSAISRRVQRLENLLGVSLFERRSSGAVLTSAGRSFVARAHTVIDDLRSAVETAHLAGSGSEGHLRVGLVASLSKGSVRAALSAYIAAHPEVDICFIEGHLKGLFIELSHRRLDVVIASGLPLSENGDGLILDNVPVLVALHAADPLTTLPYVDWLDIKEKTFIVSSREPGPEIHDFIVRRASEFGRRLTVRRHRLGREGIMTLVGLGLGVSIVADSCAGVRYPNVKLVPMHSEIDRVPFSLTWRPENDNPALRRFISLARVEAKRNGVLS